MPTKNQIRFVKSLQQKKIRNESGLFVVEGLKLYSEVLKSDFEIDVAYVNSAMSDEYPSLEPASKSDMERMSGLKTAPPIIAVVKQKSFESNEFRGITLFLDDLKDPGNLGTIIRSAHWFGVNRIIASPHTVELYNPKVIQASMGSAFFLDYQVKDLIMASSAFKQNEIPLVGTTLSGKDYLEMGKVEDVVLIIGSESHGIHSDLVSLLDLEYKITSFGEAESLNAAVACSIFLSRIKAI